MTENLAEERVLERKAKAYVERINWAHLRQLAVLAAMIALGIGAIQVLIATELNWILVATYFAIVMLFLIALYWFFKCEGEILKFQPKLERISPYFELDFKESIFIKCRFFSEDDSIENDPMPINKERVYAFCIGVFIVFFLFLIGKPFSVSFSNNNLVNTQSFFQIVVSFILGFGLFLIQDLVRRKRDNDANRKKWLRALKVECSMNEKILSASFHAPLTNDVWNQAVKNTQILRLSDDLFGRLLNLYAKICDRNNLLTFYRIGVQNQAVMLVSSPAGNVTLNGLLPQLNQEIVDGIHLIMPLLEKAINQ